MMQRPSIFLSHTFDDKPFVRKLAYDLQRHGVRVWIDEAEIDIGDSLIEKISLGIDDMDYLGVVLSPKSVSSSWVTREVEIAINKEISGKNVKVLPILYKKCEIPNFLVGKLYADFTTKEKYSNALKLVLRRFGLDPSDIKFQVGCLYYNGYPDEVIINQLKNIFTIESIKEAIQFYEIRKNI